MAFKHLSVREAGSVAYCTMANPPTHTLVAPELDELRTFVDGELRQQGNTRDLVRNIPELIEYISAFMTLEAGDLVWSGSPPGISPVKPGEWMRLEIDQIGVLENRVVEGTSQ